MSKYQSRVMLETSSDESDKCLEPNENSNTDVNDSIVEETMQPHHSPLRTKNLGNDNLSASRSKWAHSIVTSTAGGVGLNLTGGNHLIMVDLHWNPALEKQACDRIYRMGQKKPVFIHRLVTKGTIEQRVVLLQNEKLTLASSILDGTAGRKMNKLTTADIKMLFEL